MDMDGDGVLSMYELEFFYEEQCQKLEAMAIEPLPFEDCLCQMLDLVKPEVEGQILTSRDAHVGFCFLRLQTLVSTMIRMVEMWIRNAIHSTQHFPLTQPFTKLCTAAAKTSICQPDAGFKGNSDPHPR